MLTTFLVTAVSAGALLAAQSPGGCCIFKIKEACVVRSSCTHLKLSLHDQCERHQ